MRWVTRVVRDVHLGHSKSEVNSTANSIRPDDRQRGPMGPLGVQLPFERLLSGPEDRTRMTRYFEDLDVGDSFEVGSHTVTKSEIITFAEQFDPQPFHIDEEAAKNSVFGELVASGLHTLCLSVRLFITQFVNGADGGVANMGGFGLDDIRWHQPVTPGDTLKLHIEVMDKRRSNSYDDRGYVDFERRVLVDDETVCTLVSHNIIQRQPPAD